MSNPEKLIRMANQIAAFFKPYPHAQAVAGVHDHIRAFWTPRMRSHLLAYCEQEKRDLDPLVSEAMRSASGGIARSPTAKESEGPAELGELGSSDAG
jgi:formate dehydrogenase subunit delta